MWHGYDDVLMHERHRERLEQAERQRMMRALRASRAENSRYERTVLWLGHRLSAWGAILEARAERSRCAPTGRTAGMR